MRKVYDIKGLFSKVSATGTTLFCAVVFTMSAAFAQNSASAKVEQRIAYINKYKDLAIKHMQEYRIPASITLAQACLESANGTSTLAVKGNNHFGIKCHKWEGDVIYHDDDQKGECFRKYENAEESFKDHSLYLSSQRRYASLFEIKDNDYKLWASGLKSAGYATNPNYAKELVNIIEDYELYKFDSGEFKEEITEEELPQENIENAKEDIELEGNADGAKMLDASPLYAISTQRQLYEEDGRAYVFANEGDTYASIAKEYRLLNREIKKYNNASGVKNKTPLRPGTKVFLQK